MNDEKSHDLITELKQRLDLLTNETHKIKAATHVYKNRSNTLGKLSLALSKAQGELKNAKKDSANPFFNSKYADLASTWESCREPLAKNELSVIQFPELSSDSKQVRITTLVTHSSGEWVESSLNVPLAKSDAQGLGSAITYGRRYALQSLIGIAPDDDDGNAASNPPRFKNSGFNAPQSKPVAMQVNPYIKDLRPAVEAKTPQKTDVSSNATGATHQKLYDKFKTSGWSKDQMTTVMRLKFKKDSSEKLNPLECASLIDLLSNSFAQVVMHLGQKPGPPIATEVPPEIFPSDNDEPNFDL